MSFRESGDGLKDLLEDCWRGKTLVRIYFHEVSADRRCTCECQQSLTTSIQKLVLCEPPKSGRRGGGGSEEIEIDETERVIVKSREI